MHHWFRIQDYDKNKVTGAELFDKEARRGKEKLHLTQKVLEKFNFHNKEDLFSALGHGDISINAVVSAILAERHGENCTLLRQR